MEYLFTLCFVFYLVPWIVSECRERDDSSAILTVNLVAGWTVVGWLGALWWAGGDLLPSRVRPRPALRLVAPPRDPRTRRAARLGRVAGVVALAGVALGIVGSVEWAVRGAPTWATERVAVAELPLRAAPEAGAATVAVLPRGCVVAVTERRGEWRRLWRTADCEAPAGGRAAGWVRGAVTR